MTFTVRLAPSFIRQAKGILSRFPAFKPELKAYLEELEKCAPKGTQIQRNRKIWKDRLGIKSYKIGKSGGLRVLMYFDGLNLVCPIMIYYKPDLAQPTDKDIRNAIEELLNLS